MKNSYDNSKIEFRELGHDSPAMVGFAWKMSEICCLTLIDLIFLIAGFSFAVLGNFTQKCTGSVNSAQN